MNREKWIAEIENELLCAEEREYRHASFMETEEYKRLDIRQKELLELQDEVECFLITLLKKRHEVATR